MNVEKTPRFKFTFSGQDGMTYTGSGIEVPEHIAKAMYAALDKYFGPKAHVGTTAWAEDNTRPLTWHPEPHSGWGHHDGYPRHFHSDGDVIGVYERHSRKAY